MHLKTTRRAGYGTGKTLPPKADAMKATAAGTASSRITTPQAYSTGRKKGL